MFDSKCAFKFSLNSVISTDNFFFLNWLNICLPLALFSLIELKVHLVDNVDDADNDNG